MKINNKKGTKDNFRQRRLDRNH